MTYGLLSLLIAASLAGPVGGTAAAPPPGSAGAVPAPIAGPLARRRITLDLHRQDIHAVMRLLAEAGRVNIVLDPKIRGSVTLYLKEVWLSDAFEAVLAAHDLRYERIGGILYVRPRAAGASG